MIRIIFSLLVFFCLSNQFPISDASAENREKVHPSNGIYINSEKFPLLDLINSSQKSLDLEIYQIKDSDVMKALDKAIDRGVKVRVIKDPNIEIENCSLFVNSSNQDPLCKRARTLVAKIKRTGGIFIPFNKKNLCNLDPEEIADPQDIKCYQHGKMALADNKIVFLSTGNLNPSNICNLSLNPDRCNRDFSFILDNPVQVNTIKEIFNKDILGKRYNIKELLSATKGSLTVSPVARSLITDFISKAKNTLIVENQYILDRGLKDSLIAAAIKGIEVKVTLASVCAFDTPDENEAESIRKNYADLEAAGIKIRMFPSRIKINGKPGYMHAKAMVADHTNAWVGSINGSRTAIDKNREFGVFFNDSEWVSKLENILDKDFSSRDTESVEESIHCLKDDKLGEN